MKLSNLLLFLALVGMTFACVQGSDEVGKTNIAIVEQYVEAVSSKNTTEMESLLAMDYVGYGPSIGDTIRREQAIANWKDYIETLYEDINYEKVRLLPVHVKEGDNPGEYVSMYSIVNIEFKGGDKVRTWANTVYKIENGKIATTYTFYNEADVLEQLGYSYF
ncbi:MAG: nuclear transport factor 2 family protein [Cyclobacteriaceae bacterium]